jgi:lysophospholipase L1-like esterase
MVSQHGSIAPLPERGGTQTMSTSTGKPSEGAGRSPQPDSTRKVSAPTKLFFRAVLFSVSLGVCLGGAELLLRVKNSSMKNYDIEMWRYARTLKQRSSNPNLGHEHVRSAVSVLQLVEIRTNEMGMRGGPVPPPSGERRILFLGSSVTLGWGVAEDETTTGQLQKMFTANGDTALVFNAGIGNYNATRYVELFLTQLAETKPTDIVVHAFVRDAEILEAGGGNWLLQNSQLAVVVSAAIQRHRAGAASGTLADHYRKFYEPNSPGFLAAKDALRRLSDYAKQHNIRLYMAMTPDIHNLQNYPLGFVHDAMHGLATEFGYRYIDLLPAFADIKAEDLWAMPGDPHPNSLGHRKMAEMIYPFLVLEKNDKGANLAP